jgi:hypothetical protein
MQITIGDTDAIITVGPGIPVSDTRFYFSDGGG